MKTYGILSHTHTHTHTHSHTNTHTQTHRHSQTLTHRHRHTHELGVQVPESHYVVLASFLGVRVCVCIHAYTHTGPEGRYVC